MKTHWLTAIAATTAALLTLAGCPTGQAADTDNAETTPVAATDTDPNRIYHLDGGDAWINSPPLDDKDLLGKVVLIDFWEYSCVNCIRTGPYVREWHKRYAKYGLVIVGVHAPEFEFGKKLENVQRAVTEEGIKYPVVLDNHFRIWRAYENRYWPAHYLFDAGGKLRYKRFGEGSFNITEAKIQELLREKGVEAEFPTPLQALIPSHETGASCRPATEETYIGYGRAKPGNDGGFQQNENYTYEFPGQFEPGKVYLDGTWFVTREMAIASGQGDEHPSIGLSFTGAEVNLVLGPPLLGEARVRLEIDDRPLTADEAGSDVTFEEDGSSVITVEEARMYRLYGPEGPYGTHRLVVTALDQGAEAYAFTFGSECE